MAFTGAMVMHAIQQPLLGDQAYVATMAKNLAWGQGWISSVYGEPRYFDPEITTGPGLLIFIALGIYLFGNASWVALLMPLLVNLTLTGLIFWRLHRLLPEARWLSSLLLLLLLFAAVRPEMWVTPLGDLPAALYVVLASVLAHEAMETRHGKKLCLAGLLLGLAILTKTMALLPALGLLSVLVFHSLRHRRRWPWLDTFKFLLILGISSFSVCAVWWFYEQHVLSLQAWPDQKLHAYESKQLFQSGGSGLAALVQVWMDGRWLSYFVDRLQANGQRFYLEMDQLYNLLNGTGLLLITALVWILVTGIWRFGEANYRLLLVLLFPILAHLLWWVGISDGMVGRHLYLGLSMVWFVLAVALARYWMATLLTGTFLAVTVFLVPVVHPVTGALFRLPPGAVVEPPLSELMRVVNAMPDHVAVSGCAYYQPHEIEYRAIRVGRVVDCLYRIGEVASFDAAAFLERYPFLGEEGVQDAESAFRAFVQDKQGFNPRHLVAPVRWHGELELILVHYPIAGFFPNPIKERVYDALREQCGTVIFDNGFYTLHHCSHEDIRRYVDTLGGLYLPPPQWKREWLISEDGFGY